MPWSQPLIGHVLSTTYLHGDYNLITKFEGIHLVWCSDVVALKWHLEENEVDHRNCVYSTIQWLVIKSNQRNLITSDPLSKPMRFTWGHIACTICTFDIAKPTDWKVVHFTTALTYVHRPWITITTNWILWLIFNTFISNQIKLALISC